LGIVFRSKISGCAVGLRAAARHRGHDEAVWHRVASDPGGRECFVHNVVLNRLALQALNLARKALAARYRLSVACGCFDRLCGQRPQTGGNVLVTTSAAGSFAVSDWQPAAP
jgi:hypothetical protein